MAGKKLEKLYQKWRTKTAPDKRSHQTVSGIDVSDLYIPDGNALSEDHYADEIGFPGEYPFTRGVQATMYRGKVWTMRQYAGFGTAAETNKRYHYLLAHGTNGLSVAFDLPTQMGRDSDHALARGEVGRVGVAIDTIEDMETLFDRIPLEDVSTSMTINATAHILLALYLGVAQRRGIAFSKLRGTVQNDILKEYLARGTYIYPPTGALKIVTDIFEFCRDSVPQWNTISISGYHIREAGSTAVEEVALTLADGIEYVNAALKRGLAIEEFAPRLTFFFNCHNNFIEEVAKFRAARRLWAKIMRNRFGAKSDRACMLRFHTQTAGSSLTARQPLVNTVRTTLQALAAVFGGTQSLHTNGYDEALCLPTEESATLALRTQQVIASESGVADFVDPLAGSYAVESMTDEIERRASELIEEVDQSGGMVRALEAGLPQRWIEESAFRYQKQLEAGTLEVVGVNVNQSENDRAASTKILKIDPKLEQSQVERLTAFKAKRKDADVQDALTKLHAAATEGRNIMPDVCSAVLRAATLGEISDTLRKVYGEHREAG